VAAQNITCDVEEVNADQVNEAIVSSSYCTSATHQKWNKAVICHTRAGAACHALTDAPVEMCNHCGHDLLYRERSLHHDRLESALLTTLPAVQDRLMKNDVHYRFSINVLNSIIPA
jgi:hypothetical protein